MSLPAIVKDLFWPHEGNNYKARLLHPSSLFVFKVLFIISQIAIFVFPRNPVVVLAYTANISPDEIIELTNKVRRENGLPPLKVNEALNKAALAKGSDMFARNYWAHNGPDGSQPWQFFLQAGYKYKYAGENLARDFAESSEVVAAWVASPSHRENLLSDRYEEIGVAVVEGELDNVKTTIVVQFFGTQLGGKPAAVTSTASTQSQAQRAKPQTSVSSQSFFKEVSPLDVSKSLAIFITLLLVVLFAIDIIVVRAKNIPRVSSRGFAHLLFLIMVLVAVLAVKGGVIL